MQNLNYTREGSGPPLVLVHGYLGGSHMWLEQIDFFKDRFDVIAPDLPGFGRSAHLDAHDTIAAVAAHVLELLTQLDIEKFILLGHSMGGMVVQKMIALAPERVEKLICYGTGPVGVLPGRFETIDESRQKLKSEGVGPTAKRIAATWFLEGENDPGYELCEELGSVVSLDAALASLSAWESWDGRADLDKITCPSLIIWGDQDKSYNWSQPKALWKGIKCSELAVVPGCAHNVHMEKPNLFNVILEDFVVRPK